MEIYKYNLEIVLINSYTAPCFEKTLNDQPILLILHKLEYFSLMLCQKLYNIKS